MTSRSTSTRSTDLKPRVRRITAALERKFGIPDPPKRPDLIGAFILTMLSQHTSDLNADRAYDVLKQRFPAWEELADAPPRQIADAIRSAGLANQKSTRIRDFVRWIKRTFGDYSLEPIRSMPTDEIESLFLTVNGIGIKTVSVVMLFSLGRDVFPVDTHVHRICRRIGLVPDAATAEQTHHLMAPLIPKGKTPSLHVNMLRLGRTICLARGPKCETCPLRRLCDFGRAQLANR